MNQDSINKLVTEALAIEAAEAKEAGALGYMARAMAQATMPHSKTDEVAFERANGVFTLTMLSPPKIGLPYGALPRLLMAWLTTEAVRKKEPELLLGPSLSSFMAQLDLVPTGGRWGSITRLREQTRRLFSCSVSCDYNTETEDVGVGFRIAKSHHLWWDPKSPGQGALWQSTVTLSRDFFDEIVHNPVPIDLRALKALKRSPMALDIYCWVTYRMSYLKRTTVIPWGALQIQFGSNYAENPQGKRDFKRAFLKQLLKVRFVYPLAKITSTDAGLALEPSPTHIPKLSK